MQQLREGQGEMRQLREGQGEMRQLREGQGEMRQLREGQGEMRQLREGQGEMRQLREGQGEMRQLREGQGEMRQLREGQGEIQQLREGQGEMQQLREGQGEMRQLREGQEDPHPVMEGQEIFNDIGIFIQATKSVEEILESVRKMSDGQKYHLLRNHNKPSKNFIFPTQFLAGCNRAFKLGWLEEYGWWLVYSSNLDGLFCVCCALFVNAKEKTNGSVSKCPIHKMAQEKHGNRQPFNKSISLGCS
ncbi:hypothetical protein PO909_029993 [Leuciscus waleckii]